MRYVVFEGIDGSGKHEQIKLLSVHLIKRGITPIALLEPSYGRYGRAIRRRLKTGQMGNIEEQREIFTLDRRDHVETKVRPLINLANGNGHFVILQSRTYISAAAYQSDSDDPSILLEIISEQRELGPRPDAILILDLPVDQALARLHQVHKRDSMESAVILERARERYRIIAQFEPHCLLIDAQGSPAEVALRVRAALQLTEEGEQS